MNSMDDWVTGVSGGASLARVAARAGISQPTLARQVRERTLTPENVVKIARSYSTSPVSGLIACGLLTKADLGPGGASALQAATDEELVAEVMRRIRAGSEAFG